MKEDIKARIELLFKDLDYCITGTSFVKSEAKAIIKDLTAREEKLVARINALQEMNDLSVPQAYENGYNLALKRVKTTFKELGIE